MPLTLTETSIGSRFETGSYVTVAIPQQPSRQARVFMEKGYLRLGLIVRDASDNIVREEKGGWVRDKDKGLMYVAFVCFAGSDVLVFTGAMAGNHVTGAGWSPAEALKNLRKEVRLINAGSLSAKWETVAKETVAKEDV